MAAAWIAPKVFDSQRGKGVKVNNPLRFVHDNLNSPEC